MWGVKGFWGDISTAPLRGGVGKLMAAIWEQFLRHQELNLLFLKKKKHIFLTFAPLQDIPLH